MMAAPGAVADETETEFVHAGRRGGYVQLKAAVERSSVCRDERVLLVTKP
jgi:hypothetical protein